MSADGPGRLSQASVEAWRALPAVRLLTTSPPSWRSVLVRSFEESPATEAFTTAPSPDVLLVLQRSGQYWIESLHAGRWRGAPYRPGSMGVTAPGVESTLRWRPLDGREGAPRSTDARPASTVQIYLAAEVVEGAARALGFRGPPHAQLDSLHFDDPGVRATASALQAAAEGGGPLLAAETLAEALAVQLVHAMGRRDRSAPPTLPTSTRRATPLTGRQLQRVVDHLHARLAEPVGLQECADLIGVSRSYFLRAFRAATGGTPHQHLICLRMDRAARLLRSTDLPVLDVAMACGYSGTSHFASTFSRVHGVTPSQYRSR